MDYISSPFVRLIDSMDVRKAAWTVSRPHAKDNVSLGSLSEMDFSLNDLKTVAFHVRSSVHIREILTSIRPFSMWAQSSRVNPISDSKIDESYSDSVIEKSVLRIKEALEAEKVLHQDQARLKLPLTVMTEYVIQFGFRTFISAMKSLVEVNDPVVLTYVKLFLDELGLKLTDLDSFKYKPYAFSSIELEPGEIGSSDNDFTVTRWGWIQLALRAQLARHGGLLLLDNFWRYSSEDAHKPVTTEIPVVVAGSREYFNSVISARTCWMAHYEIWEPLIGEHLTYEGWLDAVPCKGRKSDCPYKLDMVARMKGDDPGIVCPIWDPKEEYVDERIQKVGKSRTTEQFRKFVIHSKLEVSS